MIEISTGPPNYIRPAFPEHAATSPVLLKELLPDDLKNIFDSNLEGDDDVEVVDMRMAPLSTTVQPPDDDDIVISETEPESDDKVAIVSFQLAAGPSVSMTALPHDDKDVSETEPETDKEDTIVSLNQSTLLLYNCLPSLTGKAGGCGTEGWGQTYQACGCGTEG